MWCRGVYWACYEKKSINETPESWSLLKGPQWETCGGILGSSEAWHVVLVIFCIEGHCDRAWLGDGEMGNLRALNEFPSELNKWIFEFELEEGLSLSKLFKMVIWTCPKSLSLMCYHLAISRPENENEWTYHGHWHRPRVPLNFTSLRSMTKLPREHTHNSSRSTWVDEVWEQSKSTNGANGG